MILESTKINSTCGTLLRLGQLKFFKIYKMNSTMRNIGTGLSFMSSSCLSVRLLTIVILLTLSYNLFLHGNKMLCGQRKTNSKRTTDHINVQNIFTSTNHRTRNTRRTKSLLIFSIKIRTLNFRVFLVRINDSYL